MVQLIRERMQKAYENCIISVPIYFGHLTAELVLFSILVCLRVPKKN